MILYIILACLSIILIAVSGAVFLSQKTLTIHAHHTLLPLAMGIFLGVTFFELIPETLDLAPFAGPFVLLASFLGFYALSYFLESHHHHGEDECVHTSGRMLLIGDAVHNIADGAMIATAFSIDITVGIVTTIGIALHEIPQEIAEFSILIRSGYSRARALVYNTLSASSILIGALLAILFTHTIEAYLYILIGIAGGNLLYITSADLLPELKETHKKHFVRVFVLTIIGALSIGTLILSTHTTFLEGHHHESDVMLDTSI